MKDELKEQIETIKRMSWSIVSITDKGGHIEVISLDRIHIREDSFKVKHIIKKEK